MKSEQNLDSESEVDEYEDFQYEITSDMASDFVEQSILPLIEEFDFNNENEDYIPGVATFGLYIKLVERLLIEGFSQDQLKVIIDEYKLIDSNEIIH